MLCISFLSASIKEEARTCCFYLINNIFLFVFLMWGSGGLWWRNAHTDALAAVKRKGKPLVFNEVHTSSQIPVCLCGCTTFSFTDINIFLPLIFILRLNTEVETIVRPWGEQWDRATHLLFWGTLAHFPLSVRGQKCKLWGMSGDYDALQPHASCVRLPLMFLKPDKTVIFSLFPRTGAFKLLSLPDPRFRPH